jgi:regulator of extracellular matrix RemA (YlzA/DUF370 family)
MYLTIKSKKLFFYKNDNYTDKENLTFTVIDFEKNIATQLTDALYDHQIQSVIIEGGRQTLLSLMQICGMKHAFLKELYTSKKALQPQY